MALATAITVFVIAIAYNQVIEFFPTGGGGYKVATNLSGPHAGLVSGSALIVDYIPTIPISVASGVDAVFSLLPGAALSYKLVTELGLVVVLYFLNLRGMQESIKVLAAGFPWVLRHSRGADHWRHRDAGIKAADPHPRNRERDERTDEGDALAVRRVLVPARLLPVVLPMRL
jgi:hypothetical protein